MVADIVTVLPAGCPVKVIRSETIGGAPWAFIQYDTDEPVTGWIQYGSIPANTFLSKADPEGTPYTLTRDTVGYLSPTEEAEAVASLSAGTDVVIQRVEPVNNRPWAYVQIPDLTDPAWIEYDGDYGG